MREREHVHMSCQIIWARESYQRQRFIKKKVEEESRDGRMAMKGDAQVMAGSLTGVKMGPTTSSLRCRLWHSACFNVLLRSLYPHSFLLFVLLLLLIFRPVPSHLLLAIVLY